MTNDRTDRRRKLAHDLRDPVAAIVTFASLLQSGKAGELNAKQLEFVDDIMASARELLALIDRGLGTTDGQVPDDDADPKKGRALLPRASRLRH